MLKLVKKVLLNNKNREINQIDMITDDIKQGDHFAP